MHIKGGRNPSFGSNPSTKHRKGCQFERGISSAEKPPDDINAWYKTLLEKPDLPTDTHVGNGFVATKKEKSRLSFTAQSLYRLQNGLELDQYIDEAMSITVGNFVISTKTKHLHLKNQSNNGLHAVIGEVKTSSHKASPPYIVLHILTKDRGSKVLRIKFEFSSPKLYWELYNTAVDKYATKDLRGQTVCFLTSLVETHGTIPIPNDDRKYIYSHIGHIETNRQFYLL